MITDEIVLTETRVWKLDHAVGLWGGGQRKQPYGQGHLYTFDTCLVSSCWKILTHLTALTFKAPLTRAASEVGDNQ